MPLRQIQEPIPIMMPMSLTMKIFPVNFIMSHYNFWTLCTPYTPGLPKFTFLGLKRLIIMALLGEPIQTTILSILQGKYDDQQNMFNDKSEKAFSCTGYTMNDTSYRFMTN